MGIPITYERMHIKLWRDMYEKSSVSEPEHS